jgi:hypothetical protein
VVKKPELVEVEVEELEEEDELELEVDDVELDVLEVLDEVLEEDDELEVEELEVELEVEVDEEVDDELDALGSRLISSSHPTIFPPLVNAAARSSTIILSLRCIGLRQGDKIPVFFSESMLICPLRLVESAE